jgi:enterochelin esterase-like enzyme
LESFKLSGMRKILAGILLPLLWGCAHASTPAVQPASVTLAALSEGCTTPGTIISADLPQPARGYPYTYRIYLPPCYPADNEARYPVLYLVPGRSSSPDTWFAAGLADVVDKMILSGDVSPFVIVTTENIDFDPSAETIYQELIPYIESQYPILDDRRYRAVAGGSLGGIAAYRLAFQYPDMFSSAGIFGAGAISGEEKRIHEWLSAMDKENRIRVFMDTGDEDTLMLERAEVMQSMLDEAGVENRLHRGHGGHNYAYWVSNFEMYLEWMARDW